MDKLFLLVKEQFPEFVRSDYPTFVAFVQAYYKWLEENSIGKIEDTVDIDKTAQEFVQYFRKQLDVYGIFSEAAPFDLKYIKSIKEIYNSKGSEQSLIFLLKTVYGSDENTKISYPRDSILKASDGVWDQERFITIKRNFGQLPLDITSLQLVYDGAEERLTVSRVETVDGDTTRVYFKTNVTVTILLNQIAKYIVNNITVYEGRVVSSPLSFRVNNGGRDWQLGQVITIPGTTKDTIARVAEVDSVGTIKRIEVLEYGYSNEENETFVVSPYPIKPVGATFDYDYDADTLTHTLSIFDYTLGTLENVTGVLTDVSSQSYFLENYSSETYAGRQVIQQTSRDIPSIEAPDASSPITLEEWIQSRATLQYTFGLQTTIRGKWLNSRGIISDNFIRLQDNFYYQQYSYVIESSVLRSKYQALLDNVHLAGSKSFSTYSLDQTLDLEISVASEVPFKWIYLDDVANAEDSLAKLFTRPEEDSLGTSDDNTLSVTKRLQESLTSSEAIDNKALTKRLTDQSTTVDLVSETFTKDLTDNVTPFQVEGSTFYTEEDFFLEDYATIGESASLQAIIS